MATAKAARPRTTKPPQVKDQPLFIGGKWLDSVSGKTFPTINPATGETICQVAEGDKADVDLAVKAARKAFEEGPWPKMNAVRARPAAQQARRPHRTKPGRAGRPRIARQRQAVPRFARRRSAADHQVLSLLRRLGRQDPRQDHPRRGQLLLLHPARAGRRRRPDHPLELPAADAGVEVGAGPGDRLHDRPQAGRADAADRPARRRPGPGSRLPRRRDQRRARLRPDRRRRPQQPHGRRQGRLHRRIHDRPDHHGGGRQEQPQARQPGAGRQEPQRRLRRRRPGRGRRGRVLRPVLQPGPVLLRRQPAVRRGEGPRPVRRKAASRRRSRRRSATRSTRRRRRGRRCRRSSATASWATSTPARRKAPSC